MKNKIFTLGLVVFLLVVSFSGCLEENKSNQNEKQTEELITSSILTLLLTLEDLPEGYSVNYSGTEYLSEFSSDSNESYAIWFSKGSISNPEEFGFITCELDQFNSIEDAKTAFSSVIDYMIAIGGFKVKDGSIDIVGSESKAVTHSGYDDIFSFRIANIICVLSTTDYLFTIDLAEIVEQRIYDSLE